jgi:hypothetical protein
MIRLRARANWYSLALATILLLSCVVFSSPADLQASHESVSKCLDNLAQDAVRPEISNWSIDGSVSSIASFVVWANVSDLNSGVLNVSVVIRRTTNGTLTTKQLMSFNGTVYTATAGPLDANNTYTIWIEAYDVALNLAQSYSRTFKLYVGSTSSVDPYITFPFVVGGGLVTFFAAVVLACIYDKRNPRVPYTDMHEQPPDPNQEDTESS